MSLVRACGIVLLVVVAVAPAIGLSGAGGGGPGAAGASESPVARSVAEAATTPAPAERAAADARSGGAGSQGAHPRSLIEADRVEFRIVVRANASARWRFRYVRTLDNDSEREQFRAFAERFEENETDAYRRFERLARGLAETGRNVTGREMRAVDFERSAGLGGNCIPGPSADCGTVTMSFTWTAFAREDGERLIVDDVFDDGLFITEDQTLVFEAGDGLAFASASPGDYTPSGSSLADSRSITYEGERSFSDNRPRVVFAPGPATQSASSTGAASPTPTPTPTAGTADGSPVGGAPTSTGAGPSTSTRTGTDADRGGLPVALLGGLFVLLVGLGAAAFWFRGGVDVPDVGGRGDGSAVAARGPADAEPAVPEDELLTDEDRVEQLLVDNGGRMKQVQIVEETGWSKSKVSMLLSDMEDEERISKLRVGRENIISLAGHEPEAAGSPHEED